MTLNLTVRNWTPMEAGNYITLSWNREGYALQPNETIEVLLTLHVNRDVRNLTDFSFEIIINANEV